MKKSLKVGLYDPYLDTLGGGELYVLSILQVLNAHGYEPTIFWDKNLSQEIKQKFSLHYINKLKWQPNIFTNISFPFSTLQTLRTLKTFDYFIYVTDGSYFFSSSKRNYIYAMVPQQSLYSMNLLNHLKTSNYTFITHSQFTQSHLADFGIKTKLLYPYIDDIFFQNSKKKKEKIILSVGRFFSHLHSKQHAAIIQEYKKFSRSRTNLIPYKLILVGGLIDENKEYFDRLQKLVKDNPLIELKPNVSFKELLTLYQKAEFFWHFTGYGINEKFKPEQVEHLGIAPLEAMASGCITFCYNTGGPKELIKNGINGFLFNDKKELIEKMELLMNDSVTKNKIIQSAKEYIKEHFSFHVFEKNIIKLFQL